MGKIKKNEPREVRHADLLTTAKPITPSDAGNKDNQHGLRIPQSLHIPKYAEYYRTSGKHGRIHHRTYLDRPIQRKSKPSFPRYHISDTAFLRSAGLASSSGGILSTAYQGQAHGIFPPKEQKSEHLMNLRTFLHFSMDLPTFAPPLNEQPTNNFKSHSNINNPRRACQ